jgi:sulfide:quinone oxidoreductase
MSEQPEQENRYAVVIIGGGTAGASVAAALQRRLPRLGIAVVEPNRQHYYQPAWTLVGGGQYPLEKTRRDVRRVLPESVKLITAEVVSFAPDDNEIRLNDDSRLRYQILIVAAGIQLNWDAIEGLTDTLGKNGVSSNYRSDLAPYTWECVQNFSTGTAIFTQPDTPIKCAGAPQKALYLAADYFQKHGRKADLRFYTAAGAMFGVPFYSGALDQVMAAYQATPVFGHKLVAVDGAAKTATFETSANGEKLREQVRFDFLHVVPPQSAPDFIRNSTLADAAGWLDVDKSTLQHLRHPTIFGLGDCTSTPNSKTAAAVKSQVPVVVANVSSALQGGGNVLEYDGYAACPLTTSAGKVLLAEFCYGGAVSPSLPLDPRVPRRMYWWLKKSLLPYFYWNVLLRGKTLKQTHRRREFPEIPPPVRP